MNKLFSLFLLIMSITLMQTMNAHKYWILNNTNVDLDVQVTVGLPGSKQSATWSVPGDTMKELHGPIDIGGTGAGLRISSVGVKPYGSQGDYANMAFGQFFNIDRKIKGPVADNDLVIKIQTDGKYFWHDLYPPGLPLDKYK